MLCHTAEGLLAVDIMLWAVDIMLWAVDIMLSTTTPQGASAPVPLQPPPTAPLRCDAAMSRCTEGCHLSTVRESQRPESALMA